jgi:hypothetical protein
MKDISAFDEIRPDEYSEAHDAAQLGMLLINKVPEHAHLVDAAIGYVFRDDALTRHGKVIAAEAIFVDRILQSDKRYSRIVKWALLRILRAESLPDFIILIDRNLWEGHSAEDKLALIDHELSHCWYATEDDGETQKFHRDGSPWWAIRAHDFEGFCGEIERNGPWSADLMAMARSVLNSLSRNQQHGEASTA